MSWRGKLLDPAVRTRLAGSAFALAGLVPLPIPSPARPHAWNAAVFLLWLGFVALAWTSWNRPDLARSVWFLTFVISVAAFFALAIRAPFWMSLFWGVWRWARWRRLNKLAAAFVAFASVSALAADKKYVAATGIPSYITGYKLSEISSCGAIEKIPWKFRKDGRQTRVVLKDVLRKDTDSTFSKWEVHQVMDREGVVSYIFRRSLGAGRTELLVTKDASYNRFIEEASGKRKLSEVANLSRLIGRATIGFSGEDGSTLTYAPGLAGQSRLTIQLAQGTGRLLPPLFLSGSYCDRPDFQDENVTKRDAEEGKSGAKAEPKK